MSHKYQGPQWDARKDTYPEWWWEAAPYLDSLGLEQVRKGRNRGVLSSPETLEATQQCFGSSGGKLSGSVAVCLVTTL